MRGERDPMNQELAEEYYERLAQQPPTQSSGDDCRQLTEEEKNYDPYADFVAEAVSLPSEDKEEGRG